MKLNDYLKQNGIKLTELEKEALNCIRSQGSFYEEGLGPNGSFERGSFFGWEIYESEVKDCRDAISGLVKKDILTVDYDIDMDMESYYINYEPEFDKQGNIIFEEESQK